MEIVLAFFAGAFIANGIPHFVKGVTGQTHMTPFKRVSSAELNVIWGVINFAIGLLLLNLRPFNLFGQNGWAFIGGVLVLGLTCAFLFSKPNARLPWQKD